MEESGGRHDGKARGFRPPFRWRALVLPVLAAAILSIVATLLLGGSSNYSKVAASSGCGMKGVCRHPEGK